MGAGTLPPIMGDRQILRYSASICHPLRGQGEEGLKMQNYMQLGIFLSIVPAVLTLCGNYHKSDLNKACQYNLESGVVL